MTHSLRVIEIVDGKHRVVEWKVDERVLDGTLGCMQRFVGGLIEVALNIEGRDGRTISLYCNEEGNYIPECLPNVLRYDATMLVGPCFISAIDRDGETVSLTDDDIARVKLLPAGCLCFVGPVEAQ